MEEKKETFTFTYSASQQEEVKRIREKYAPATKEEDKMERLRRLDRTATKPGTMAALIVGIISTLIMGVGMCCTMVWSETLFVPGIVIGMVGIIGICAAYPLYLHITKKRHDKLAPEIMRLADELIK
jgi:hypothetical protein